MKTTREALASPVPQICRCVLSFICTLALAVSQPTLWAGDESADKEQPHRFLVPADVQTVIDSRCIACHGEDAAEGDVRLDTLAALNRDDRLDLLNRAQEQIFFGTMPPGDASQPTEAERLRLADWVSQELNRNNASRLEDKLRKPEFGNYVDHDKLFSGEYKDLKAFTYDRRWLISEFIFNARFNRILNHKPFLTIDGKRQYVIGDNNRRVNLTNPFLLPSNSGVRYYANTTLNGGHLLTMITNAKEAAAHMVYLTEREKRYLPAIAEVMAQEWEHKRILTSREDFLNRFIDRILQDLYKDEHSNLLPTFVRTDVSPVGSPTEESTKKAPFHAAQPGNAELVLIFRSMRQHQEEGDSDERLIEKCEHEWFNFGHNARKIQARVTFLKNYMAEWRGVIELHRYDQKHKPVLYRPAQPDEMEVITATILKHRRRGDRFNTIIDRCMAQWRKEFRQQRDAAGPPDSERVAALVDQLFVKILERSPSAKEAAQFASLVLSYIRNDGSHETAAPVTAAASGADAISANRKAIENLIQTLMLTSDFAYRQEFGQGDPDEYGRRMLSPRDAGYAIAYALTDSSPDADLVSAADDGRLRTKEDYAREVHRLLAKRDQYYVIDEQLKASRRIHMGITNMPIRKLRFFREFFGYPGMLPIFKDMKRFGGNYENVKRRLIVEADRLVDHIVQSDRHVFEELLTTEEFYVFHSGDNESMTAAVQRIQRIHDHFKDTDWQNFTAEDLAVHKDFIAELKMRVMGRTPESDIRTLKTVMTSFTLRFDKGQTAAAPYNAFPAHGPGNGSTRTGASLQGEEVTKFFNIALDNWNYPSEQPAGVANRKGLLTHPAWLIAHAQNTETDPVRRGKWIREKLLAGTIPDIPITVDAVIPEDHHKTLRQRLDEKTGQEYCWNCHKRMNPLGLAFEMYDDFGRYRTEESLEHPDNLVKKGPDKAAPHVDLRDTYKTLPVNAQGYLDGTGDDSLDGQVDNAIDLMKRLGRSERVRQSIVRHAFRYFMGRNEVLSDSPTLIEADRAYVESHGSFDAVIVSLLTSDSFIYRKSLP